jgi:hypothetical protein
LAKKARKIGSAIFPPLILRKTEKDKNGIVFSNLTRSVISFYENINYFDLISVYILD